MTNPKVDELQRLLGQPEVTVNSDARSRDCPNCGKSHLPGQRCDLPNMETLLERFGADCNQETWDAVQNKRRIIEGLPHPEIISPSAGLS
jgi:hypothetical protein